MGMEASPQLWQSVNDHERRLSVVEERVDGHDKLVEALVDKLDEFKTTVFNATVTLFCAMIGASVAIIVALMTSL